MPKYYIDIEFMQGQSRTYSKFPLIRVMLENDGKYLSLREIGQLAGVKGAQQVKHYLLQMMQHGFLYRDGKGYRMTPQAKRAIISLPSKGRKPKE